MKLQNSASHNFFEISHLLLLLFFKVYTRIPISQSSSFPPCFLFIFITRIFSNMLQYHRKYKQTIRYSSNSKFFTKKSKK